MKKTYSTPEIQTVLFSAPVVMSTSNLQSGGKKDDPFVGESKSYNSDNFLWDDTEE